MFPKRRNVKKDYSKEEMKDMATDFLKQYYTFIKSEDTPEHQKRLSTVFREIDAKGIYDLTFKELSFGCRTAWRNAPRCINRIQWRKLEVFDSRDVRTAEEMFAAMVRHIQFCSNPTKPGVIRSAITVFPAAVDTDHEYHVWNSQFIKYAGYKMPDGTILGDPADVEFTEVCIELGWKPPDRKTAFDVLPVVLQANGGQPQVFDLEPKDILEINLTHPKYPEFDSLEMKWYAIPGVSNLLMEIGGLRFTAAPFSGWYMVTEVGARDLGDPQRYNMLEKMARIMKLDMKTDQLWKDKALVELNAAVLHSYNKCGVSIMDHHSASESFMKFLEQEYRERGGCPADWVWIVPPMSGSATRVFHQEMLLYHLTPSFEYQEDPVIQWKKSKRPKSQSDESARDKFKRVVRWAARLAKIMQEQMKKRRHCTILYATETGRSETYARMLLKLFGHAFNCDLYCMDSYSFDKLQDEEIVLIVASTFGSGDPPSNGEEFAHQLVKMRAPQYVQTTNRRISTVLNPNWGLAAEKDQTHPLSSIKFAVFGLGSRAYPDTFCAFAHSVDKLLDELGGERIHPLGEGDELCGQEESFRDWAKHCYDSSCKYYNLDPNLSHSDPDLEAHKWGTNRFRLRKVEGGSLHSILGDLRQFHNRPAILGPVLKERVKLQSADSPRSTIKLVLDFKSCQDQLQYEPGDHLSVFPENSPHLVSDLLDRLNFSLVGPDDPVILEYNKSGEEGADWMEEKRFTRAVTIREAFTFFLDITTPPTPQLLKLLATQAKRHEDIIDIEALARGETEYEEWKYNYYPNMIEVIDWFYSLHGNVDPCLLLSQLPLLQSRYYSISSSPKTNPGQVDITVAVVAYHTKSPPDAPDKVMAKRFSIHPHPTKGPKHFGVCSNWLNKIEIGSTVPCFFRKAANFHMPLDPMTPIIMVGPGTGIAPFRSFWEERIYQIEKLRKYRMKTSEPISPITATSLAPLPFNLVRASSDLGLMKHRPVRKSMGPSSQPARHELDNRSDEETSPKLRPRSMSLGDKNHTAISEMVQATSRDFGPMYLFFGCRQSNVDHLYKEDMRKAKLLGALDEFCVGFSREQGQPKMYVQDKMREDADMLVKLLLEGAHFYVCGDISMARDVQYVLNDILVKNAAMTVQEAKEFVDAMKENNMYHEDIFGVTLKTAEVTDRYRTAARRTWNVLLSRSADDVEAPLSSATRKVSRPHKLSRLPTVTLLLGADTPNTPSETFKQIPLPSGRKLSQPAPAYQNVHKKHLKVSGAQLF
jgi:nitric oxide synthase oxygenase domain/subunit/sulfite reductase alpha subunit-like flavoprotein